MRHSQALSTNATSQLGPQFAVLQLRSWPDLRHVTDDLLPDVLRICALLAFRPTGAPLIHRLVGIPRERALHIVDMLHLHGHLGDGAAAHEQATPEPVNATAAEADTPRETFLSVAGFLDRFLKKLIPHEAS